MCTYLELPNILINADGCVAGYRERVCRAWHVTMQVQVLQPGFRRAEG